MTAHQKLYGSHEALTVCKNEFQRKGNPMQNLTARVRVLQLVGNLTKEQRWEHLVGSIIQEVRIHVRHISTDKHVLDKVPPSIEIYFQTILSASSTVEFEKTREAYAPAQCQQKVQQGSRSKGQKKENPKPVNMGLKVDSLKSRISKPTEKKKQPAAKVIICKPAPTEVKEPGED